MAKQETVAIPQRVEKIYSDQELREFDQQLEKYKVMREKDGVSSMVLLRDGELRFLADQKAIVYRGNGDYDVKIQVTSVNEEGGIKNYEHPVYETLMEKLRQRQKFIYRMDWGRKQRLLQLDSLQNEV